MAVNCSRKTVVGTFAADWHDSESIVTIASVSVSALDVAIQQFQVGELDRNNWHNLVLHELDSIVRASSCSMRPKARFFSHRAPT